MTGIDVTFTPLYGAAGSGPLACLLQIRGLTLLLDAGWGEPYDPSLLQPLLAAAPSVDAVLLSHPDPTHLGALPLLVGRAGLDCPIFAAGAIHKMGQMFMYNEYLTHHAAAEFPHFDLDDVDTAFSRITQLRFRQETPLGPDASAAAGAPVSVTPLPAGHLIGGTVWRVVVGGEEIVYAMDFNHRRERHLAGTPLESAFHRPAVLIADAAGFGRPPSDRERAERALLDAVLGTLRADGSVLLPVDAAGRLLELLLVFEHHWSEGRLPYPVALVGPMVHTTLEFARSQLEWMNEALVKSFGHSKDNPFALRYVRLCASLGELRKLPPGPKVVLAVGATMGAGPSRQLFVDWAQDPRSLVALPLEPPPGSLAAAALVAAAERDAAAAAGAPPAPPPLLHVVMSKRVQLKGEELEAYLAEEAARREAEAAAAEEAAAAGDGAAAMLVDGIPGGVEDLDQPGGGSPRSMASGKSGAGFGTPGGAPHPTRANVAAIGHAARDAAGLSGAAGSDADVLGEELEEAEGAVACLIEGFEVVEGAAGPLFPAEDEWEAVQYDEYGAVVDPAEFEGGAGAELGGGRLAAALASEAEAERAAGEAAAAAAAEEEALEAAIPTKIETKELSVPLAARVVRFDFDGRSDGRSVQTMLAHVAPRATVLVHAGEDACAALAAKLASELEGLHASVATPASGEATEIPLGASFEIELSDRLMRSADMHAVGVYELAWVDGCVGPPEETAAVEGADAAAAAEDEAGPGTEHLPTLLPRGAATGPAAGGPAAGPSTSTAAAAAGAPEGGTTYGGVFIGDVRLSELKKALAAAGVRAEFHGGALYCAGQVVVRRHGEGGGLILEGALGDAYYKVRSIVYGQYHVC